MVAAVLTASKATEGQLLHSNGLGLFPLKTPFSDYEMQVWISKLTGVTGSSYRTTNVTARKPLIHTLTKSLFSPPGSCPSLPLPPFDSSGPRPAPPYRALIQTTTPMVHWEPHPKDYIIYIGRGTVTKHAEAHFGARSPWTLSHRSSRVEVTALLGHRLI